MIYVSIPVHEAIEVIMDQVTNFIKFLPDCHIIQSIHLGEILLEHIFVI